MVLADTSVWVDHLRHGDATLTELLGMEQVVSHAFVVGELACGNLRNRGEILGLLETLDATTRPDDREVLYFIEKNRLQGRGLGYIDVSLLATCVLAGVSLYTRDARLSSVARQLGVSYPHEK